VKTLLLVLALGVVALGRPEGLPSAPSPMGAHCLMPRPTLMAQEGNPGHKEPPPGWTCAPQGEHACACHRECVDTTSEDEDGTQTKGTVVKEDSRCRVYCFMSSCRCPVHNCD
jgi:hypothetical protein